MADPKLDHLDLDIIPCTDLHGIIKQYYHGLRVEYISDYGIKYVEWIPGRKLTYDTKRRHKLVSITGSGVYYLEETELFTNCYNLVELPKHVIVTVNDMHSMFLQSKFNGDISRWDVSRVTDMQWLFGSSKFNGDISGWNVSNVTNMYGMFYGCNCVIPEWYRE